MVMFTLPGSAPATAVACLEFSPQNLCEHAIPNISKHFGLWPFFSVQFGFGEHRRGPGLAHESHEAWCLDRSSSWLISPDNVRQTTPFFYIEQPHFQRFNGHLKSGNVAMQIRAQNLLGIVRSWLWTTAENWQCPSSHRCGNLGHVWNLTFGTRRKNASWDKLENQWLMEFGKVCTFRFSVSRFPFAFPFPGLSLPLCFFPVLEFHFSLLYFFLCLCGSDLANDYLCIQMVRVLLLEVWNFGIQSCLNGGTCLLACL